MLLAHKHLAGNPPPCKHRAAAATGVPKLMLSIHPQTGSAYNAPLLPAPPLGMSHLVHIWIRTWHLLAGTVDAVAQATVCSVKRPCTVYACALTNTGACAPGRLFLHPSTRPSSPRIASNSHMYGTFLWLPLALLSGFSSL